MPIIQNTHTSGGAHILIWKDVEELDFFLEKVKLSKTEVELLNKYTNDRRKKDLLISRHLLQMCIPGAEVFYYESGKPYLRNSEMQISISHSRDLVAVITHPLLTVGIDIEYISTRVERLKERFLSPKELDIATNTETMILLWSAKETLFKLDKKQGLDFKTQLSVSLKGDKHLTGKIRNGKNILLNYQKNSEWVLTYGLLKE